MTGQISSSHNNVAIERSSNFELLRLVLMFLIIFHHSIVHGLGLSVFANEQHQECLITGNQTILAIALNSFCICAVNCFILISGFFSIKTTVRKFSSILFSTLFYTILFSFTFDFSHGSIVQGILRVLIFSHETYWFITSYLLLMVIAPVLNAVFDKMSTRYQNYFLLFLIFITSYLGFVWGSTYNYNGYNLTQFITLYCIGRFIRLRNITLKRRIGTLLYVLGSLLTALIACSLWKLGFVKWSWHMTFYNNPLLIISAIGLFMLFNTFNFRSRKINSYSTSCLAIYMIQSSLFGGFVYYSFLKNIQPQIGLGIWLIIPICTAAIMYLSILFDKLTQKRINNTASTLMEKLYKNVLKHACFGKQK